MSSKADKCPNCGSDLLILLSPAGMRFNVCSNMDIHTVHTVRGVPLYGEVYCAVIHEGTPASSLKKQSDGKLTTEELCKAVGHTMTPTALIRLAVRAIMLDIPVDGIVPLLKSVYAISVGIGVEMGWALNHVVLGLAGLSNRRLDNINVKWITKKKVDQFDPRPDVDYDDKWRRYAVEQIHKVATQI